MAEELLCAQCGYQGKPKLITRGGLFVEIVLWICFIIPGVIYSSWRRTRRYKTCPECEAPHMIPLHSPMAQKILQDL